MPFVICAGHCHLGQAGAITKRVTWYSTRTQLPIVDAIQHSFFSWMWKSKTSKKQSHPAFVFCKWALSLVMVYPGTAVSVFWWEAETRGSCIARNQKKNKKKQQPVVTQAAKLQESHILGETPTWLKDGQLTSNILCFFLIWFGGHLVDSFVWRQREKVNTRSKHKNMGEYLNFVSTTMCFTAKLHF